MQPQELTDRRPTGRRPIELTLDELRCCHACLDWMVRQWPEFMFISGLKATLKTLQREEAHVWEDWKDWRTGEEQP